jgi:hypothetical protein
MNAWLLLRALLLAALAIPLSVRAEEPKIDPARREEIRQQLAEAKAHLKLTPEQETQLKNLLREQGGKLQAIRASDESRLEKMQKAKAVREDFRSRLTTILSPEQLTEWDRLRDEAIARAKQKRSEQQ